MKLTDGLRQAVNAGLDRLDAQMLLLLALGRDSNDRAWLLAHDDETLPSDAADQFDALCQRRRKGEPFAYLSGQQAFFGLDLQVDARVLVPRPDTEVLVDWALDALDERADAARRAPAFLDLGTGSGAIALAVKSQRPGASVSATDASADALTVAQANAQRLRLDVGFHPGHWLGAVPEQRFDVIASNPPYIAQGDRHLHALTHEPLNALAAGPDGLDDLREIVAAAPQALWTGGWLLLEHGYDQAEAVRALLVDAGFDSVNSRNDLAGIARCSGGQWPHRR